MRVNVYAEEMTDRIEIIKKTTPDGDFTGLRFYLELPVSIPVHTEIDKRLLAGGMTRSVPKQTNVRGPFNHHPGDDDSAAVTFWGKQDLRTMLRQALVVLDKHYATGEREA